MGMRELDEALALVEQNPDEADFVGRRDERLVAAAERALGLTFPPTYRGFLLELGEGSIAGDEYLGVTSQQAWESDVRDGVGRSLRARERWHLPSSMVLVSSGGMGGYFVLDTKQRTEDLENPVLYWEPGRRTPNSRLDRVEADFGTSFSMKSAHVLMAKCLVASFETVLFER